MPELPEVEITKRGLQALVGKQITNVEIGDKELRYPLPMNLSEEAENQCVKSVERRAKYVLVELETGYIMMHMGNSGSILLDKNNNSANNEKHVHLTLKFNSGDRLLFRCVRRRGCVLWLEGKPPDCRLLDRLGKDPLDDEFNEKYLKREACCRTVRVKKFILEQEVVAGMGNIYASESLFRAGISPKRKVNDISENEYSELVQSIRGTMKDAIKEGGTSLGTRVSDWESPDRNRGNFSALLSVYGKDGDKCTKCNGRGSIEKNKIDGRMTYYCKTCQKVND